jgi:dipeptidyl aminopeptidase/acylaminoacyl peptidase
VNVFETGKIAFFSPPANDWEVAFVSERDGNPEIYVIAADGSNPRRLTDNEAIDGEPAWSPDGSQIAFHSARDGNFEIYVMDADGGNAHRVTQDPAADLAPAWSPDGSQIAFVSTRDGGSQVYVADVDGSNPRRLSGESATDDSPAWSPDGSQLAFVSTRDGPAEIYLMNSDGSNSQRVTDLFGANGWYPAWSPNGQIMSFTVERDQNADIYTMDRTGENVQRLTGQSGWLTLTDWSPDGQWIVRMAGLSGNADLYVMSADGADLFRLTDDAAEDYAPDWRPPRAPSAPCVIRTDRDDVNVRVGPGDNRGVFTTLPRDQDFRVVGQAADDQGRIWWTLDKTQIPNSDVATSLWVNSEDVEERGDCFAAQVVEPPPIIFGAPPPPPPGTWGGCGSCDTCGHPGECVISPDGQCLWDPATCHTGDVPPPPNCFSVTKQVRIDTAGIAASITLRPSPNCGSGYQPGTLITAVASSQCQFIGWSGSTCPVSGGQTASFTVTSSCVIVANFNC